VFNTQKVNHPKSWNGSLGPHEAVQKEELASGTERATYPAEGILPLPR